MTARLNDLQLFQSVTWWLGWALVAISLLQAIVQQRQNSLQKITDQAEKAAQLEKDKDRDLAISTSNRAAEEAKLEAQQLKAKLAWREISPKQKSDLLEMVKSYPKMAIEIITLADNEEARDYGSQIKAMLQEAGYPVIAESIGFGMEPGFILMVTSPTEPADHLVHALKVSGIPVDDAVNVPNIPHGKLVIAVGPKRRN